MDSEVKKKVTYWGIIISGRATTAPNFRSVDLNAACKRCVHFDGLDLCEKHNISFFDYDNLGESPHYHTRCGDYKNDWIGNDGLNE